MDLLWLGCIISLVGFVGVFVLNAVGVYFYAHPKERSILSQFVTLMGISLSQLAIVLIPLDVYNASSANNAETWGTIIEVGYYVIFVAVIFMVCVVVPFTYFYSEQQFIADEETTIKKNIIAAMKYTSIFIGVMVVLFVVGLFMHSSSFLPEEDNQSSPEATSPEDERLVENFSRRVLLEVNNLTSVATSQQSTGKLSSEALSSEQSTLVEVEANTQIAYDYLNELLDSNVLIYSVSFTYFSVTALGFVVCFMTYTNLGMSVAAIRIIRGNKRVESEKRELEIELQTVSKNASELEEKYSKRRMSEKQRSELDKANYKKEEIEAKLAALNDLQNAAWWKKLFEMLLPFKFLLGVGILLVSLGIIVSMGFTQIIRFLSSDCGMSCGFVITSNQALLNPIDLLLTYSSAYFPIDVALFVFLVGFMLFASLFGIMAVGIRFLWIKMFNVKPRKTISQALAAVAFILMLCSLCIMLEITTLAPQYATFGARTYVDTEGETNLCSMSAGPEACPMTQIAQIVNRFYASLSIFGAAFYFATWLFIGVFFLGIGLSVWLSRPSNVELEEDDFGIDID